MISEEDIKDKNCYVCQKDIFENYICKKCYYGLAREKNIIEEELLYYQRISRTQWRSVEDELPKLGQKVLLISGNIYREEIFTYDFYEDLDGYAQVFYWKSENMGRSEKISKNDLWMPLPTPPEGE